MLILSESVGQEGESEQSVEAPSNGQNASPSDSAAIGAENSESHECHSAESEENRVRIACAPNEPTREDIESHNVSHLPCEREIEGQPTLQVEWEAQISGDSRYRLCVHE